MYQEYFLILDKHLRVKPEEFLIKIINDGGLNRLISDFQVFSLRDKIRQYYYTSIGIRLGQALEEMVEFYLTKKGANFNLDRRKVVENYDCDQIFTYNGKVVLIEQKIRDDHDSSKKRGQVDNYLTKRKTLTNEYQEVLCCSWFIDKLFEKNKKYYLDNLGKEIFYGDEIENFLVEVFGDNRCSGMYLELISVLRSYRINYSRADIFDNLQLDCFMLQPKGIWELLMALKNNSELEPLLFCYGLDRVTLLKHLQSKRSTEYTKRAIALLEEK